MNEVGILETGIFMVGGFLVIAGILHKLEIFE
jgi:hypothetical protein